MRNDCTGQGTRVLVVRGGALGDFIVTVPALRALRRRVGPETRLTFVGNAPAARALAADLLDEIVSFEDPAVLPLFGEPSPAHTSLFKADLTVLWLNDPSGVRVRAARDLGARCVLQAPPLPAEPDRYVIDHLVASLAPLGAAPVVEVDCAAWLAGETPVGERMGGPPLVAVHPGSGSRSKNWPADRLAAVVRELSRRTGESVVVVCGPSDEVAAAELRARLAVPVRVERPAGLAQLVGLLRRARLYVGNDSGVSHLAAGLGVPSVVVFGPTDPRRWAPRGPRVTVVAPPAPGPMTEVAPSVADVLRAVERVVREWVGHWGEVAGLGSMS
jgi:ADP-heptose:LPS heptosyltransferase